jgi:hypothetical protein
VQRRCRLLSWFHAGSAHDQLVNSAMAALPKPDEYQVTSEKKTKRCLLENAVARIDGGNRTDCYRRCDQHMKQQEKVPVPPSASYTMLQQNNNASNSGDDAVAVTDTTATDKETALRSERREWRCYKDATDTTKAATSDSPEEESSLTAARSRTPQRAPGTKSVLSLRVLRNATTHTCRLVQRRKQRPTVPPPLS